VTRANRFETVALLLNHFRPISTLAFCNTKQQCRELATLAAAAGLQRAGLYGELEQRERDQVLAQFANRSCSVLVATDVASRGLDIAQLEAVINVTSRRTRRCMCTASAAPAAPVSPAWH
jgi:ATP-independent RNA helicase DbpA